MDYQVKQTADRIRELRNVLEKTPEEMAKAVGVTVDEYLKSENGELDFSFTFLHKCANAFGVDIKDLITGEEATLKTYSIVRSGDGEVIQRRSGFSYNQLAAQFKHKLSEPFLVKAPYVDGNETVDISLSTHNGEEFDYILKGKLRVSIDGHIEILNEGDSIYYNSSTPHGMVAVGGNECDFIAVVIKSEDNEVKKKTSDENREEKQFIRHSIGPDPVYEKYIDVSENSDGSLKSIHFKNCDHFNFAYDVVDKLAEKCPEKLAMIHVDNDGNERYFTFRMISELSNRAANYFVSLQPADASSIEAAT